MLKLNEQRKVETGTPRYLEMVDEILGVYVDAASVLLVRHERQPDVDAAVVLALVDLSQHNRARFKVNSHQTKTEANVKIFSGVCDFFLWSFSLPLLLFIFFAFASTFVRFIGSQKVMIFG